MTSGNEVKHRSSRSASSEETVEEKRREKQAVKMFTQLALQLDC
jgi:hypothetical protein